MAKEFSKKFYKSKRWNDCRKSFISKRIVIDGGVCEHCHDKQGEEVDHIIELTVDNIDNPSITLNHDNLQYLCHNCHTRKTKGVSIILFDDEGQPILK